MFQSFSAKRALLAKVQAGDHAARNRLAEDYSYLVSWRAACFLERHSDASFEDAIGDGRIGFLHALDCFREHHFGHFYAFAARLIDNKIEGGYYNAQMRVSIPGSVRLSVDQVRAAFEDFVKQHEREPRRRELLELLGWNLSRLERLGRWFGRPVLMKERRKPFEEKLSMLAAKMENSFCVLNFDKKEWENVLSWLVDRDRRILEMRFGLDGKEPMPLRAVGKVFDISQERVRQLEERALSLLAVYTSRKELVEFSVEPILSKRTAIAEYYRKHKCAVSNAVAEHH